MDDDYNGQAKSRRKSNKGGGGGNKRQRASNNNNSNNSGNYGGDNPNYNPHAPAPHMISKQQHQEEMATMQQQVSERSERALWEETRSHY